MSGIRLKLVVRSSRTSEPIKVVWPISLEILQEEYTILDLVYSVYNTFPWFFSDEFETGDASTFDPSEYLCSTKDGWHLCFWHSVSETLKDEDELRIEKLAVNKRESYRAYNTIMNESPESLIDEETKLIGTTESKKPSVQYNAKRKVTCNEDLHDSEEEEANTSNIAENKKINTGTPQLRSTIELNRSPVQSIGKRKVTGNKDLHDGEEEDVNRKIKKNKNLHAETSQLPHTPLQNNSGLPFEGKPSTKARNQRRRNLKKRRKLEDSFHSAGTESNKATEDQGVSNNTLDATEAISVSSIANAIVQTSEHESEELIEQSEVNRQDTDETTEIIGEGITIMDKIGLQIQSALFTLSQALSPNRHMPASIPESNDNDNSAIEDKKDNLSDQENGQVKQKNETDTDNEESEKSETESDDLKSSESGKLEQNAEEESKKEMKDKLKNKVEKEVEKEVEEESEDESSESEEESEDESSESSESSESEEESEGESSESEEESREQEEGLSQSGNKDTSLIKSVEKIGIIKPVSSTDAAANQTNDISSNFSNLSDEPSDDLESEESGSESEGSAGQITVSMETILPGSDGKIPRIVTVGAVECEDPEGFPDIEVPPFPFRQEYHNKRQSNNELNSATRNNEGPNYTATSNAGTNNNNNTSSKLEKLQRTDKYLADLPTLEMLNVSRLQAVKTYLPGVVLLFKRLELSPATYEPHITESRIGIIIDQARDQNEITIRLAEQFWPLPSQGRFSTRENENEENSDPIYQGFITLSPNELIEPKFISKINLNRFIR
ncbi:hypothetical protein V1514DRAFT_320008 [Lipomyces japonicus]|uniref:uncharacterized protein n=1 Tax=Lipomyces japonicus TaxID=56871 RepID=UPI0034CFA81E